MKKLFLSISLLSSLTFIIYSCDKKKDDPKPGATTSNTTSGSTTAGSTTAGTTSGSTTATTSGSTTATTSGSTTNSTDYKALLKGTWTVDNPDMDFCDAGNGLHTFGDTKYTITCPDVEDGTFDLSYSLSIDGKTLTIENPFGGGNQNFTVKQLTATKFVYTAEGEDISHTKKQ